MKMSETSKPSVSAIPDDVSPKINKLNITPFKLECVIGTNPEVAVVNLTTRKRNVIAYACSHVVILHDYVSRDMKVLQGHQNAVRSLSASRNGKWLLSADYDEDCICIIWDTETRVPICTLFNPHGQNFLTAVELSPDAKFLVTVGNEISQSVKIWTWTRGHDEPDATVELMETSADRVKRISFDENDSSEFILTLDRSVIFVSWKNSKSLATHRPTIPTKKQKAMENFNDSCYVTKIQLAMTVTKVGFVIVWSNVVHSKSLDNQTTSNDQKRFVKAVPIKKGNLTSIKNTNEIIVIGNDSGQLFFYDRQLKLLYWCKNCGFDSIVSMSFDRESHPKSPEIASSHSNVSNFNYENDKKDSSSSSESNFNDHDDQTIGHDDCGKKFVKTQIEPDKFENTFSDGVNNLEKAKKLLSASTTTVDIDYQPRVKGILEEPTDCTLQNRKFVIPKFFVSSACGKIGRLDVSSLSCRFVVHPAEGAVTAIATRPKSDYVLTGNSLGLLRLYKFKKRMMLMVSKKTPVLPNFLKILNFDDGQGDTSHVTCPKTHESLGAISALRFSPAPGGILACGLESGTIWILDPNTLDPIDHTPHKHSSTKILDLVFSECGKYLGYTDDAFTVGIFKKNDQRTTSGKKIDKKIPWIFLGKYHSHNMLVRQILFSKSTTESNPTRFFSLGEDRNLVEYDLNSSGPYPDPGLKILNIETIEQTAVPTCMAIYPKFGSETFLITANSEWKLRLVNDRTKITRGTFLGPTFGDPIQRMLIVETRENKKKRGYMIFATSREIGLMILPYDGNPCKIVAMTGHPRKIQTMAITDCGRYLYTVGHNDRGVLVWRIRYRSVNAMEQLGGVGIEPFHSLIDGGEEGWLFKEMKDLFYYSQILQQGENTTSSRIINDRVTILQLPNLMRAIGFYPTNSELENMMEEVAYKSYEKTGNLIDEITFEDFVKLYVNHRPAFGTTKTQIKTVFEAFANFEGSNVNSSLTAKQFLDVLFGRGRSVRERRRSSNDELYGEPLTLEEAHACLRLLVPQDDDSASYSDTRDGQNAEFNFDFLPTNITYENFTEEILGIGQPD